MQTNGSQKKCGDTSRIKTNPGNLVKCRPNHFAI